MSEFFLKVVNMSIAAGWIMLVVLLLRLLLKKAPKWMRMILWGIVAIRLIFPFTIESVVSLIPSAETISPEIMLDRTPEINSGISSFNHVINPIIGEAFTPNPMDSANPLQIWIPVLANVWILGMIGMVLYSIISYLRIKRKVRTAVLLHDNIFQSENVFSPFVLGMIKPKIYLPFHINEHDLEYVIAHENAHIRRKDHWWKPFGFLILTFHWFNPLMWFGYVLFCRDIELACDEKVVQKLNHEQKANYSQALLNCSVNRHMIAACPLAFGEVGVKDRVKMVLCYKKPAFWLVLIAIIASAIVAVCFLTDPKREIESNGIEIHMDITFDAVELVYDDGMYSFVQTIDKTPEYMLVNDMQLLEKTGESVSEPLGKFREITLNKNNFDSRFRSKSKECWPEKDTFRSIKRNNVRAWQLYANSSSNIPYLYILLEQKDGTFYLGHGYYDFKSNISNNPDSSHIRWLYKLKKVDSDFTNSKIVKTYHETDPDLIDKAYENEELIITRTHHQMDDGLWVSRGYGYMYRLEITGRMHNAAKNTTYIVLSNSKDITFDQTWKASGFSSNMDDYFHPEDAVIVGHRLFE